MRTFTTLLLPVSIVAGSPMICMPEGPIVPKPSLGSLSYSPIVAEATANLTSSFDGAVAGAIKAGWATENTSFSIALVSMDQADAHVPLWEYHHLAEANTYGAAELNRDTQYLIGSISKVLSDYILLVSGIDIEAPVTRFIPKLGDAGSLIKWGDVSLRMLASHLSGTPANYGFSEYYYLKEVFESVGLPPLNDSAYPSCGVIGLNEGCSQNDLIGGLRKSYPVTATNSRPAYSNIAFTLIFMALENITGKNYTALVDELLSQPLGLRNTRPAPGDNRNAVIPPGDSSWGSDYGLNAPGGGLVSSLSDLTTFLHGILSRTLPISPSQTREWLKPASYVEGSAISVGMPWEVYRSAQLTPAHPHDLTLYGKGGGALSYRSQLYIADDYGVGFVILTAGSTDAVNVMVDAVLAGLLPAIDEAARREAELKYARIFSSSLDRDGANTTSTSATFTLDGDSLVLSSLRRGDADVLGGVVEIFKNTIGQYVVPVTQPMRLFLQDGLEEQTTLPDGVTVTKEVWRLWPTLNYTSNGSELPGAGLTARDKACFSWTVGDWVHYGSEPLDRVLFYRDERGDVVGFEAPFLRSGILKPESSSHHLYA